MGTSTPLPLSAGRILLAFLERYGIAVVLAIQLAVLSLPLLLATLATISGLIALSSYLSPPLRALLPPIGILVPLALARFVPGTRGERFSVTRLRLRDLRRYMRNEIPIEFGVVIGIIGLAVPIGMLMYAIVSGASHWWWLLLVVVIALAAMATQTMTEVGVSPLGNLSFLSNEKLEETLVEQIETEATMPARPALYVTRLREQLIERHMVLGLEYVRLASRPMQEVAECLVSTSAIAGILPTVKQPLPEEFEIDHLVRGKRTVFHDAGWIDNTPIAALLEHERCDVIIVVFLDHALGAKDIHRKLLAEFAKINASIRAANADLDESEWQTLRQHRLLTPIRDSPSRLAQVQLIPIIPSEELGKGGLAFLRETLWFRRSRVRHLIDLGERDAAAALAAFRTTAEA
jgi:hypothetical protein